MLKKDGLFTHKPHFDDFKIYDDDADNAGQSAKNPYEFKDGQPIPYGYFGEKYRGGDPIYGKDPSRRPPNQEFDQLGMERSA